MMQSVARAFAGGRLWMACGSLGLVAAGCESGYRLEVNGQPCVVRRGATPDEVAAACGPPDGFRYQPKVVQGLLSFEVCSAPVYVYDNTSVAFGCDRAVGWVNVGGAADEGVPVGAEFLIEEIEAGRHIDAALVELARQASAEPRTLKMIETFEQSSNPRWRAGAAQARRVVTAGK